MFFINSHHKDNLNSNIKSARTVKHQNTLKSMVLNFGPQHPAAHGILKIVLLMSGEVITKLDSQFGYLHRGTEKLCEQRSFIQNIPYFDRMDYTANLFQEHAYCASIELLNQTLTKKKNILAFDRLIPDELSRILNHLLTASATSFDIGSMGPIF